MSDGTKVVKSGVVIGDKTYDLVETNHYNCDGCDLHVWGKDATECVKRNGCLVQGNAWPFCHFHEVKPCP